MSLGAAQKIGVIVGLIATAVVFTTVWIQTSSNTVDPVGVLPPLHSDV